MGESKKANIWLLNGPMNQGGTESLIMEILRHQSEKIQYTLLIHSDCEDYSGSFDSEINELGIPMLTIPAFGKIGLWQYYKAFGSLINRYGKPDAIHIHMNAVGGMIAAVAQRYGVSVRIIHCHADITYKGSLPNRIVQEIKLQVMRIAVNTYGTHFWACSDSAAKRLFYPFKPRMIIPNMINVEKYYCQYEEKDTRDMCIHICSVGRVSKIKNYETIIRTIKSMCDSGVKVIYSIYGRVSDENYYSELKALVEELKVTDIVLFKGGSNNVPRELAQNDVFVMPSISEGLGIAALEAQAAGLPTLVSTGVPRETDMGLNLIQYIEPNNESAWRNAILNSRRRKIDYSIIKTMFQNKGYDSELAVNGIEEKYIDCINGSRK